MRKSKYKILSTVIAICICVSVFTICPNYKVSAAQTSGITNGGIYNLKNVYSGKYLNVHMGYDVNATNVYQWSSDGSI